MRPAVKTRLALFSLFALFSLALSSGAAAAEDASILPTSSPRATVRQMVATTEIEIDYGRPRVRGREIFGNLVILGQVWRTGADAATTVRFSTPVTVGEQELAAGTYELFTIPRRDEWTVILQEHRSQWGSYAYDPANDSVRVTATPEELSSVVESLTIGFEDVRLDAATLTIAWDRTRVAIPLSVDLETTVVPALEEALAAEGPKPYFRAAMFYYESGLDLDRAEELMARALEPNPDHVGMLYRQALIRVAKGDDAGATRSALACFASAKNEEPELRREYMRLARELLIRLQAR